MFITHDWQDYEVIDASGGEKLERWGDVVLRRPDPQAIWDSGQKDARWNTPHAHYLRSSSGGGEWDIKKQLPERWTIAFGDLQFYVRPTGFKHTGLFPEQAVNWQWMMDAITKANRPIRVLNLFAYTGGATVACSSAGADVCHVDSAKGMVQWAKENAALSGLQEKPIRYIVDDCLKFVQREQRRGNTYDAVIMDPPSYGRGPNGEVWKLEDELFGLVSECVKVLSQKPLFFLINSYTTGLQPLVLHNMLQLCVRNAFGGTIESAEVGLPVTRGGIILPCGASGRWQA